MTTRFRRPEDAFRSAAPGGRFPPGKFRRWAYLSVFWLLSAVIVPGTLAATDSPSVEPPEPGEARLSPPPGLADLIPEAAALNERFDRLVRQLEAIPAGDPLESRLQQIETRVDSLAVELGKMRQEKRRIYERLLTLRLAMESVDKDLLSISKPLTEGLRRLDRWRSEWRDTLRYWRNWEAGAAVDPGLDMVQTTFFSAIRTITTAQDRIFQRTVPMMAGQKRAFETQVRVNRMLNELEALINEARAKFLRDFSPPMYRTAFFAQFGDWLAYDLVSGVTAVQLPDRSFYLRSGWVIALQILFSLLFAYGIRRSKNVLEGVSSLRFLHAKPHSVGWLLCAVFCWNLYGPMPGLWQLLLVAIIVTTTARLVGGMIDHRPRVLMAYLLAATLLVTRLLGVFELPLPIFRLYLVFTAAGFAVLCLLFLLRPSLHGGSRVFVAIAGGVGAATAAVAVIEICGYSSLALHIFQSTLTTVFIVMIAWLLTHLVRGLLETALRILSTRKIRFLQTQLTTIIDRSAKLFNLMILLLFAGAILQSWRIFTNPWDLIHRIFTFGVTVGESRITLGLVLAAAACLYGSLLASQILQFFMVRDVFARRRFDPGIGQSITRLLHYAVVLLGVLLALTILGFKLTNLTIIASALSVGIGFGLQTIVNNFVCGLILLFERPVKVGDIIQLGEQWATIRDIGLRATTIQTFDQSDIVVPNSDLITNQVTNWTLADRRMRLILSVGVAYGSDVPMVLKTLEACYQTHARVLKNPAPVIFFMGFGDSSLDFQLRVWIDDINYMNAVRSELNQEIERRFRERGIEIPFPQRDLHLRSVVPAANGVFPPASREKAAGPESGS